MANTYITGKYAYITFNGQPACMDSWELDESTEPIDVTNWCSVRSPVDGGIVRAEYEPGLVEGTWSTSGPYRGVAPVIGEIYEICFGVNQQYSAVRSCLVLNVKVQTEVKGKATINISGKVVGIPAAKAEEPAVAA
jgi:hypothetical protein